MKSLWAETACVPRRCEQSLFRVHLYISIRVCELINPHSDGWSRRNMLGELLGEMPQTSIAKRIRE